MANVRNRESWLRNYARLVEYSKMQGHCFVPRDYIAPDGFKLGIWVSEQRKRRAKQPPEDAKALEALPGWSWNAADATWRIGFIHLQRYMLEHGHPRVPRDYQTASGFSLGEWLTKTKAAAREGRLRETRLELLRSLPRWASVVGTGR